MSSVGENTDSTAFLQRARGIAEGAGGIDDVVGNHAGTALHFADDVHDFSDVGAGTALIDDREINVKSLRHRTGADHAAHVRRNDHQVRILVSEDVVQKHRGGIDVIHRNVKEALNLISVKVHREDAVNTDRLQHVRNNLRADGHAGGTRTAILTGIAVVRNCGGNSAGRSTAQSVHHDHQLHQIVVRRSTGALQHENILTTNVLVNLNSNLTIGEAVDCCTAQWNIQVLRDRKGKLRICIARENHKAVRNHDLALNPRRAFVPQLY